MAIDIEKTRRIMQRLIALGYCICKPERAFANYDVETVQGGK